MTDQEIINYHAAMAIGHALMRKKLIRKDEFLRFEKKMMEKYHLPENSIFRDYMIVCPPGCWEAAQKVSNRARSSHRTNR